MQKNNNNLLRDLLGVEEDVKEVTLGVRDKMMIKRLLKLAPKKRYLFYFDLRYVDEIFDGYEFKDEEEEFYYNNSESYFVFRDITDFKVKIKISTIEKIKEIITFEDMCTLTAQAIECTKKHPSFSKNKVY